MKLTTKLVSALVLGTIVVLGIETYFSVRDDVQTSSRICTATPVNGRHPGGPDSGRVADERRTTRTAIDRRCEPPRDRPASAGSGSTPNRAIPAAEGVG